MIKCSSLTKYYRSSTGLEKLANRPFSALLSLGCYILSCVLMTSDAGVTNFFTLIVVIIAAIRAYGLLKEGETI